MECRIVLAEGLSLVEGEVDEAVSADEAVILSVTAASLEAEGLEAAVLEGRPCTEDADPDLLEGLALFHLKVFILRQQGK